MKKSQANKSEETNTKYFTTEELQQQFEKFSNVSLRKLAGATDVTYGILLKASKAPIKGVAYDPEATNFEAINNEFIKRKIDITELNWEEMNQGSSKATLVKDHSAFLPGMKVFLRRNATVPYEIIYKTDTHIVIMLEGTTEPQSWQITTFMFNGPVFEPRTVNNEPAAEAEAAAE